VRIEGNPPMSVFDLTFVLCAVVFNLLIIGIYITSRHELVGLRNTLGKVVIALGIPLSIVFIAYAISGRPVRILLYMAFILIYLVVEIVLDFILKIEFRKKPVLHIPYIVLFYAASFGFVGISFSIDATWGYVVATTFWGVLGSLVYFLLGGMKKRARQ
jgi:hypothetical protein